MIYLGAYEGCYSVRDEAFYDEDELTKRPDGTLVATASGAPVEWVEDPSYFFKLSAFQDKLLSSTKRTRTLSPRSPSATKS